MEEPMSFAIIDLCCRRITNLRMYARLSADCWEYTVDLRWIFGDYGWVWVGNLYSVCIFLWN